MAIHYRSIPNFTNYQCLIAIVCRLNVQILVLNGVTLQDQQQTFNNTWKAACFGLSYIFLTDCEHLQFVQACLFVTSQLYLWKAALVHDYKYCTSTMKGQQDKKLKIFNFPVSKHCWMCLWKDSSILKPTVKINLMVYSLCSRLKLTHMTLHYRHKQVKKKPCPNARYPFCHWVDEWPMFMPRWGLNHQPLDYQSHALPTELLDCVTKYTKMVLKWELVLLISFNLRWPNIIHKACTVCVISPFISCYVVSLYVATWQSLHTDM